MVTSALNQEDSLETVTSNGSGNGDGSEALALGKNILKVQ